MASRSTVYRWLWIGWCFFLSACAGFGAFTLFLNLGVEGEVAVILGTVAFTSVAFVFDRDLGTRDFG